jgi:hypothetical protein
MSMKNSSYTIGNRTRDLPTSTAVVGYCTNGNTISDSVERKAVGKSFDELKDRFLETNVPQGMVRSSFSIKIVTFGSKKQLDCKGGVNTLSHGHFVSKVSRQCFLLSVTSGHL